MSVEELIQQLRALDPTAEVLVRTQETGSDVNATISVTGILKRAGLVVIVGDLDMVPDESTEDT